jgi:hypothetical protein
VKAARFVTVVVALSVALSYAVEAQAEQPKPEPPSGTSSQPLRPDPVPSAQPAPPTSASSHHSGPSSVSSGYSAPASVTPSTHGTSTPVTGVRAHAPVAKQHRPAAPPSQSATRRASRRASAFLLSLTSFLAKETKLPAGVAVSPSTSSTSTLLLVGAFALVVLALGEATFLTFIGRQVGIRPERRRREPRPAAYWDAEGPIRRVPLDR